MKHPQKMLKFAREQELESEIERLNLVTKLKEMDV